MNEIIVVGAGIIGASVAYRLSAAGARVTVVEAAYPGAGTSSTSLAWVNANAKEPDAYHYLNHDGMAEHRTLARELGGAWLHLDGNLSWEREPKRLEQRVARLRRLGYGVELLTPDEVAQLEPDLQIPPGLERIAFFPQEGYVEVLPLIGALLRAGTARLLSRTPVTSLHTSGGRVAGVTTPGGTLEADLVVTCLGRWTDTLLAPLGIPLPLAPSLGLLAITTPVTAQLRSLVHTVPVNFRPDGGGRVMIDSGEIDAELTPDISLSLDAPLGQRLLALAAELLPALANARLEALRLGTRAFPADGISMVGPAAPGLYTLCTHSGVTLGPLLGRLAAEEIMSGRPDPRLAPFRPARFGA